MYRFDYVAPATLDEALATLQARGPGGKILAGGTDLLVQIKEGRRAPAYVLSLGRLDPLRQLGVLADGSLEIGSRVPVGQLARHPLVRERYPLLAQAARLIGSVQIRNLATIGGNCANAAPSADLAPPLLALGATVHLASPRGPRQLALEEFFLGPGRTALSEDEILVAFRMPAPAPGSGGCYLRHTPRKEMDIAVVGVGAVVRIADGTIQEARIVLGAVAPTPLRARETEAALVGQPATDETIERAAAMAANEARPIDDVRASATYRRHLVRVLTRRALERAVQGATNSSARGL